MEKKKLQNIWRLWIKSKESCEGSTLKKSEFVSSRRKTIISEENRSFESKKWSSKDQENKSSWKNPLERSRIHEKSNWTLLQRRGKMGLS